MDDFLVPEFVLLGADDDNTAATLKKFYATLHNAPLYQTAIAIAKLAKVADNTYISMKIIQTRIKHYRRFAEFIIARDFARARREVRDMGFIFRRRHVRIPPVGIFDGTKHAAFADIRFPKGSVVIDPWRDIANQSGVKVIRVGE